MKTNIESEECPTPIIELIDKTLFQYTHEGLPFMAVVDERLKNKDLIAQFDRLYGAHVGKIGKGSPIETMVDQATGFYAHQLMLFVNFVYDCVWSRMPTVKLTPEQITELIKKDSEEKNK